MRGSGHVDLVRLSGGAVLAIDNVYGRALATLSGDEHRVQGFVAAQGAYEENAGQVLAAVDVTREGELIELANALVTAEKFGFGPKYLDEFPRRIRAVTLAEVNKAVKGRFHPDRLHTIVAGDLETLP